VSTDPNVPSSPTEPIIIIAIPNFILWKMMGMIADHTGYLLESMSSRRPNFASLSRSTSNDDIPEMIMSASLQSFESLHDSLPLSGSRSQSPTVSPRSIFHSYWSSPKTKTLPDGKNNDGGDDRADDDILERLRTLKMPLSERGTDGAGGDSPARAAAVVVVVRPTADGVVEHRSSATSRCGPSTISTLRRQILPPPPPPAAVSPMRMLSPPSPEDHYYDEYDYDYCSTHARRRNSLTRRPWSSTTALGGRPRCAPPSRSCLRKSRYSFSSSGDRDLAEAAALASSAAPARLHLGLRNRGHVDLVGSATSTSPSSDMSRSVSFYSEVSVVEYAVPREQRRSQEGWSRYCA
jgi:hypothetical protein